MRTRLSAIVLLTLAGLLAACSSSKKGPTKLWEDLPSYAPQVQVRERLHLDPSKGGWVTQYDQPDAKGSQHYLFARMIGPRESYGVSGELTLTFYNDRLMSTSFNANCEDYMGALRGRAVTLPQAPSRDVTLDVRTQFRYYEQGTNCRFLWTDPQLEQEWKDWSKNHG
jgi:hypothetical protein